MSVEYFLSDHLGSTSLTTNMDGAKISEMRYKPWGKVRSTWTSAAVTTPAYQLTRYTFTDQYSYMDDPSTATTEGFGLMFYNARWMDPYTGRFVQADSIVPAGVQGLDRYAYTFNNPVNFTDPTGHMADQGNGGCTSYYDCHPPKPIILSKPQSQTKTLPTTVNDYIYQTLISPLEDASCNKFFGAGNCTNGTPNITIPKIAGSPFPTHSSSGCGLLCWVAETWNDPETLSAISYRLDVFSFTLDAVGEGVALLGLAAAGPVGYEYGNWAAQLTTNRVSNIASVASTSVTAQVDYLNNSSWKDTINSAVTTSAGFFPDTTIDFIAAGVQIFVNDNPNSPIHLPIP